MHIGIVVNPQARRASDPELPERLGALCEVAGAGATVLVTRSASEVASAVAQLYAERADVLCSCGGDGTLLSTVTALVRARPAGAALPDLLLLPGGTMNTVAKNLGQRGSPEAILQALLDRMGAAPGRRGLAAVPAFPQELLRLRTFDEAPLRRAPGPRSAPAPDEPVPVAERYGFLFTAAMGARFLLAYAQRPGPGPAALLALRTVLSSLIPGGGAFARWLFQPTPARVSVDGEELPLRRHRVLLAATVPDVGLGMRVPWRGGCVPGRFNLIASALPLWQNALQLPRLLRGQPLRGAPHEDHLARTARLDFEQQEPLSLDGELFSARAAELSLGPTLRLLLPCAEPPRSR
jgi:diacylglycerol kinase family enzyme